MPSLTNYCLSGFTFESFWNIRQVAIINWSKNNLVTVIKIASNCMESQYYIQVIPNTQLKNYSDQIIHR